MSDVVTPAFADKLPQPEPTLDELAERAIAACEALSAAHDTRWNACYAARNEAQDAFRAQFWAVTGLSQERFEQLIRSGVL